MIPGPSRDPDHPWLLPSILLIAGFLPPGVHPLAMAPLALAILLLALDLARRHAVASAPAGVAV
ncbi:MAG TPA: hypothetical protein VNI57_15620, partial [Candidatus Saccharimonadales bacterium]|nr:hypothetical protein [Candidatus Saccharimonadales bacterium]